ncbi:BlaI/MecI/CopY family transcriptional regulator [Oceanicoccus sp. KOV_DT_Chl]|uniref:BlaI/MecI/CopY family transcriptional regulator n=1 Tax=Oceanicoccus sp. KOV_DT_Chl TaxID=1904639 RepID=UPI000C7B40DF|nr:BlaI/MecI/CopY family transcriptional regulator [Oceanicoccus sp. KOV_DT_Chl]
MNKLKAIPGWLGLLKKFSNTPALGERELSVLEVLWSGPSCSAQQVLESMPDAGISLSTVQSTLERLHRKKLLSRTKNIRTYFYQPLITREQIISSLLSDITREIAGGDMAPMISGFKAFMGEELPLKDSPVDPHVVEADRDPDA